MQKNFKYTKNTRNYYFFIYLLHVSIGSICSFGVIGGLDSIQRRANSARICSSMQASNSWRNSAQLEALFTLNCKNWPITWLFKVRLPNGNLFKVSDKGQIVSIFCRIAS